MRYEEPIMDIMYLEQLCVVVTSSIKDGTFGTNNNVNGEISGDGF